MRLTIGPFPGETLRPGVMIGQQVQVTLDGQVVEDLESVTLEVAADAICRATLRLAPREIDVDVGVLTQLIAELPSPQAERLRAALRLLDE